MRIWFNHWFSTAYHLINLMREGSRDNVFIGTSTNSLAVYKQVCDEWYSEEDGITADAYVDFAVDFCVKHEIDVFVPRRFLVDIIRNADRFDAIGVRLFADRDYETVNMLDDKFLTYDFFRGFKPELVPEILIAHSFDEFISACNELKTRTKRVCYKLTVDEGARSFRVIDDRVEDGNALLEMPGAKISWANAQTVLSKYDFSIPMLVMPYLYDVEISVDCLHTNSGNIIIPRYKKKARYSEVIFDESIMKTCSETVDRLKLRMPLNIQFRMNEGNLYLMEMNPRMSGGLQLSCLASGINIPDIALSRLCGVDKPWTYPEHHARKVAHIETPICLD